MDYKNLYEAFTKKVRSHVDMVSAHAAASTIRELSAGDSKKKALDAFDVEMRKLHTYVQEQTEHLSREMLRNETLSEMMEAAAEADTLRRGGGSTLRIDPPSPSSGTKSPGLRPDPNAPRKPTSDSQFSDTSKNQQQLTAYSSKELPTGDPMADRDSEAAFRGGGMGAGPEVTLQQYNDGQVGGTITTTPGQIKQYSGDRDTVFQWGRDIVSGKNQASPGIRSKVEKMMSEYELFKNDKGASGELKKQQLVNNLAALQGQAKGESGNAGQDPEQLTPNDFTGGKGIGGAPLGSAPRGANASDPSAVANTATASAAVQQRAQQDEQLPENLVDLGEYLTNNPGSRSAKARFRMMVKDFDNAETNPFAMYRAFINSLGLDDKDAQKMLTRIEKSNRLLYQQVEGRAGEYEMANTFYTLKKNLTDDISSSGILDPSKIDSQISTLERQIEAWGTDSGATAQAMKPLLRNRIDALQKRKKQVEEYASQVDVDLDQFSQFNQNEFAKLLVQQVTNSEATIEPRKRDAQPATSRDNTMMKAARQSMQRSGGAQGSLSATDIVDASAKANEVGGGSGSGNERGDLGSALGELKRKIRRLAKKRKDSNDEKVKEKLSREIEKLQDDLEKLAISLQDS
ncbi:hypothetical protein OAE26_02085 [Synechococcus sp. AH-551-E05]|nr:hypothetical protein [Synechococcus sp. AH-551-E05]MDB4651344.1 hypothetical protein [Synechococcus sp. AH-551-E05]